MKKKAVDNLMMQLQSSTGPGGKQLRQPLLPEGIGRTASMPKASKQWKHEGGAGEYTKMSKQMRKDIMSATNSTAS